MDKSVIEAIAKIEKENFTDPWTVQMIDDTLRYNYNFIVVMTNSGIIIYSSDIDFKQIDSSEIKGYLIGNVIADESELLRIAVAKQCKGQGYSKEIMSKYFEYTSENCNSYFLEVRSKNDIAINLYKKMGYEQIGNRRNYYSNPNDDALIFKK